MVNTQQQAYHLFASARRQLLKQQHTDTPVCHINRMIGEQWRSLSPEDRDYWIQLQLRRERLNYIRTKRDNCVRSYTQRNFPTGTLTTTTCN